MSTPKPPSVILDEIEARASNATPGPWDHNAGSSAFAPAHRISHGAAVLLYVDRDRPDSEANFDFVAAARTDVPALVKALRHARDRYRAVNDGACPYFDEQITAILNQKS